MIALARKCRSCGGSDLRPLLAYGEMPLADGLLPSREACQNEPRYPLTLVFCAECSLVQIVETVQPETLFCDDYPYFSSFSDQLLEHSRQHAHELIVDEQLDANSWVVEIASNDGYLLKNFVDAGIPVTGIDPAEGPAQIAIERGVNTEIQFFTEQLAEQYQAAGRQADVIIANNVLAHVADTNGFVAGLARLLKHGGVATLEFPYLRDLVDHCEFDTIYHEHLCYFSLTAVDRLFRRHGLIIHDVRRLAIHGGSLRLYASHARPRSAYVTQMLHNEQRDGLTEYEYYRDFATRSRAICQRLRSLLETIRGQGRRVAAYGAAAKGATLLNFANIGSEFIDFVVDRNTHKHGRFMPGVHLPIMDVSSLAGQQPDYALLLAWNFRDEILSQQKSFRDAGGKFIVPVPDPAIV